ncbi:MAG: hypothetical protein ABIZ64_13300 [Casimicrobium sp.]|jgi:hypothetical protein
MKFQLIPTLAVLAMAIAVPAQALTKTEYKAAGQTLDGDRKAAITACSATKGNEKSVCVMEAKGKYEIANAELDAKYKPSAKADRKVRDKRADVAYDIAKAKCSELTGNPKDVCVKEAKSTKVAAKADAKVAKVASEAKSTSSKKVTEARKDAMEDKSDAAYAAAKQRCDALAGDAKTGCLNEAKAKFGKS